VANFTGTITERWERLSAAERTRFWTFSGNVIVLGIFVPILVQYFWMRFTFGYEPVATFANGSLYLFALLVVLSSEAEIWMTLVRKGNQMTRWVHGLRNLRWITMLFLVLAWAVAIDQSTTFLINKQARVNRAHFPIHRLDLVYRSWPALLWGGGALLVAVVLALGSIVHATGFGRSPTKSARGAGKRVVPGGTGSVGI
jgi:hypothetical protein